MAVICPTITATGSHEYREQMERLEPFAKRIHIDLMDGKFAPTESPSVEQVWWKPSVIADIHLMYQRPLEQLSALIKARPNLVIIHAEAEGDHGHFASVLQDVGMRAGLALLPETSVESVEKIIPKFNHVLIFSGHLGYHGGHTDLSLLKKIPQIRGLNSDAEIGWDGGINDQNAKQLVEAGIDVLNVGGFIQKAAYPKSHYQLLEDSLR